ncbi:MAG: hypothetical protein EOO06_08165 [Chitinophagaceae bacterium]|nr:MAG: hypothetical protein EOO06_08165 [Chitinophagaceae bacterium]
MKLFAIIILFTGLAFQGMAQAPGCRSVQTGKFKVSTEEGTTFVTRTKDSQTEEDPSSGTVMIFDVKWLDECTYTLRPKKLLKGDPALMNKNLVLTVAIKEVNKQYYMAETTFNLSPMVMTFRMDIVN